MSRVNRAHESKGHSEVMANFEGTVHPQLQFWRKENPLKLHFIHMIFVQEIKKNIDAAAQNDAIRNDTLTFFKVSN